MFEETSIPMPENVIEQKPENDTQGQSNDTQGQDAPQESPKESLEGVDNPKLSIIARMEKRAREQSAKIKEEQRQIEQQRAEFKEAMEFYNKFKENPLEALNGKVNLDELYQKRVESLEEDDDPIRREIRELKEEREREKQEYQKKLEEFKAQESKQFEEKKQKYIAHLDSKVAESVEKFPLLALGEDQGELIYKIQDNYYKQTKKTLSEVEAMELLHGHLEEKFKSVIESNSAVKDSLLRALGHNVESTKTTEQVPSQGFTLDNQLKATSTTSEPELSEFERIERAKKLAEEMFKQ